MGNSCKCISKLDSRNQNKKQRINQPVPEKKGKNKTIRWERIMKAYSDYEYPLEAFKRDNNDKFCAYLSEGPPANLRWLAWKAAFSAHGHNVNIELTEQEDTYSIEKDLSRTFPNQPFFSNPLGQTSLKTVLVSMVNNHPELGYCQGMNSLAGILLIVSKGNVTESYEILEKICMNMGGKGLFEYGFPLVVDLCQEFHRALSEKIPTVHKFFQELELDDNLWITKWFMTLFSYSFHLDCVVRIWDAIFAYGLGFMVNIALGLVSYLKHDLLGKSLGDMLEYLPELKEMYVDIDMVLFHSGKFQLRKIEINIESEACAETLKDEIVNEEPILTRWDVTNYTHQHSRSMMEEFSLSSPSNISKFSL